MKNLLLGVGFALSFLAQNFAFAGDGQDWLKFYKKSATEFTMQHGDYEFSEYTSSRCNYQTVAGGTKLKCGERNLAIAGHDIISFVELDYEQTFKCMRYENETEATVGTLIALCEEMYSPVLVSIKYDEAGTKVLSTSVSYTFILQQFTRFGLAEQSDLSCVAEGVVTTCQNEGNKIVLSLSQPDATIFSGSVSIRDVNGVQTIVPLSCRKDQFGDGVFGSCELPKVKLTELN